MKTTLYTVLCVAIRLGAVLFAATTLERVAFQYEWFAAGRVPLSSVILVGLGGLLIVAVLWLWPGLLARLAISRQRNEVLESAIDAEQLQRVALTVLGAWISVQALGGLLAHGALMVVLRDPLSGHLPASEWRWLIEYAVEAAGGLALMLGSGGLGGLLQRLRR